MNPMVVQMVNHKVNNITASELVELGKQYQMPINKEQAEKVVRILRSETINVSNKAQVERMIERLKTEVDPKVSTMINQLLQQFGQYL
ncbi:DUF2624 family protein [Bacillus sp. FJAT-45350]|uniref:DUF2624 family protein n=1 Tax=Bacillus sp. FJAT-45350 TaxID=2011014 RepID=UPI000BB78D74|nr:DUF2624 family protein [Bacillus sp. FJAT-45350]